MNLIELLKRHEGLKLKPYFCTEGKVTIGFGRNLEDRGISEDEAELMLKNDICLVTVQASENFPWFKELSQTRKDVVLSMIFNLGLHGFAAFRETISAISKGDYQLASAEMLQSHWASQVGKRAYELSEMMRTDQYLKF